MSSAPRAPAVATPPIEGDSRDRAALWALAALIALSFAVLLALSSRITFFLDDWAILLHRRGFGLDVILDPNNEHPAMVPVLLYKALLATFGMDSARPYQVAEIITFLASCALLFVWLRRRVGPWLALAATAPILFLGSGYEDLLWQFQIGYFGSMACGLGALLALDRDDRVGDRVACLLLVGGLTFSSVGIPFVIAAAVCVAWDRRRFSRAYVFLVPAALYAAWWLGWGHTAQNSTSLQNLATSPGYLLEGLATSLSSLLGLATARPDTALTSIDWGRPLLLGLGALAVWRVARIGRIDRRLAVVLTLPAAFWILAASNADVARPPTAPRYQWVGAVFVLMIAAELLRGVRPRRALIVGASVLAVLAVVSNLVALQKGSDGFRDLSAIERGGLAGLEIARDSVDPAFRLNTDNSDAFYADLVDPRSYFSAVDAYGSPAYPIEGLASAPEVGRIAADKVVAAALGLALEPSRSPVSPSRCKLVGGVDPAAPTAVTLPPGGALLKAAAGADAQLYLRRFAQGSFPVELEGLGAGDQAVLAIASDRSSVPWQLGVAPGSAVSVCELPAA